MIESKKITVERSFRFAIREAQETTETLVYLLHGYGQLAHYFLRKVEHTLPKNVTFIAPEGMHRFYLQGNSGRVGASWMTKEGRELDIIENTHALNRLHERLLLSYQPKKILVIGFSQGGATATRWLANGDVQTDGFVSWASVFPPDISAIEEVRINSLKKWFVIGSQDPYFNQQEMKIACNDYVAKQFEVLRFEGGHDLKSELIEQIIHQL